MTTSLGQTFLSTGRDYDRYRPGFPEAALDLIVGEPVETALDLGAGTGKLTELLVHRAREVTAVDPSESMLAELHRKLPAVRTMVAPAEQIPLPEDSQDVVTVAQAFHWFDRERASSEIARVLRPGGRLGLLWNGAARGSTWDLACYAIAHPGATENGNDPAPAAPPGFRLREAREVPWVDHLSREHYVSRWLTVSSFLAADPARRAEMVAAVEAVLDADPSTRGRTMLELPTRTWVEVYELQSDQTR